MNTPIIDGTIEDTAELKLLRLSRLDWPNAAVSFYVQPAGRAGLSEGFAIAAAPRELADELRRLARWVEECDQPRA
jgi:hypothetical protein